MSSSLLDDPLGSVGRRLPSGVQEAIAQTSLHRLYLYARAHTTTLESVQFETEWGTIPLRVPPDSYQERPDGPRVYEPGLTSELFSVLGEDDVFYDVGAHHGYVTQLARVAGVPAANVHSFEPNPFNFHVLSKNTGTSDGTLVQGFVGTRPDAVSIDDYAAENGPPTVAKVDVEGAEYDVLRSMRTTLRDHPVRIYVEIHPGYLPDFGDSVRDVQSLLDELGYEYAVMAHRSDRYECETVDDLPRDDGYLLRARPADAN